MLKLTICDETWTIKVLESLEALPECSDNPEGVTFTRSKEIYFRKNCLTKGLIRHELFHAHYHYLYICAATSRDDREETLALWLEHRGDLFGAQVDRVYEYAKRHK